MKKLALEIIFILLTASCAKDPNPATIHSGDSYLSGPGLFVVNEGNFRSGNGSLSFFSYDSVKVYNDVFLGVNKRTLGDIPYSMTIYGDNTYIVVNNSGKIEVVQTGDLKSINTVSGLNSPRFITFVSSDRAYISSLYSDSLAIFEAATNTISGYIDVKRPSESIVAFPERAYVGRWTGDNKIIGVNTLTNQVTDSIEVGMEPESMVIDRNEILWVLCNGGWQRQFPAELVAINTTSNTVVGRFIFPSLNDSPTCLQIDGSGENLFYLLNGVKKMSIFSLELPSGDFIPSGGRNFYKIGINPVNGDIFVTDAADYQQKGYLLRYKSDGEFLGSYETGIIPGNICFKSVKGGTTR